MILIRVIFVWASLLSVEPAISMEATEVVWERACRAREPLARFEVRIATQPDGIYLVGMCYVRKTEEGKPPPMEKA